MLLNKEKVVVTYTTFDQKVREHEMTYRFGNEKCLDNIVEYMATKQWPEEPIDEKQREIEWGLKITPKGMHSLYHNTVRQFPNETQFLFHRFLQVHVVGGLAAECSDNADFAKAMLQEAAAKAKKKDEEYAAWCIDRGMDKDKAVYVRDFTDALNRAKKRIRYHQTKPEAGCRDDWNDFCRIIEEFELFTILDFKKCE